MERNTLNNQIINVIFHAGRGSCQTLSREACVGEPLGPLPVALRPGYHFDGWFTQSGQNGERVTEQHLVSAAEDITLYARYSKSKGKRKKSSLRTQKRALFVLAAAIAALILVLVGVNYLVSIIPYVDYDGAKYKAKRTDGVYSLYDADGVELPQNEEGYYLTSLGTQLSLDRSTGAITEYAVVDLEGIEVKGANSRIMMFAQIRQADVARIEVQNQKGSFAFYLDKDGNVQIEGFETNKQLISYDQEKYAYLCVGAGYPLTMRKLNTEEVQAHGYAEYGLEQQMRTDGQGNEYLYTPTRYTVTAKNGVSHTVLIGDPIVSEAGYYVKLDDENAPAVYIMSNTTYEKALLCSVEELITPLITYPTTVNNYFNVENFVLASLDQSGTDPEGNDAQIAVAFDYIDIKERSNSLYSASPYRVTDGDYRYNGYLLNDTTISTVQEQLYQPRILRVCKLGPDKEDYEAYGLATPAYLLSYDQRLDNDGDGVFESTVTNSLLISERTERDTYYVASALCDVIVEAEAVTFGFVEYEPLDWICRNPVWINLAFLREMTVATPDYSAHLVLDNSASDQSSAISSANITFTINGVTPDYIVYKTSYGSGRVTEETPVYNLRQFYTSFLNLSIVGSTEEGQFTLSEEDRAALRALPDSECQLVLTLKGEELATKYNPTYHDQNNKIELTYRFYRYSEGRSYMTVNGEGEFFVDASFVEKLISDTKRLEQGILVDPSAKT